MPHPSAPNAYPGNPRDYPSSPDDRVVLDTATGSRTGSPTASVGYILSDPPDGASRTGDVAGEIPGGVFFAVDPSTPGSYTGGADDPVATSVGTNDASGAARTGAPVDGVGNAVVIVDLPKGPTLPSTGTDPSPILLPAFTLNSEGSATGSTPSTVAFTWIDAPITSRTGSTVDLFGFGVFVLDTAPPGSRAGTPGPETLFFDQKPNDPAPGPSFSRTTIGTQAAEITSALGASRTGGLTGETVQVDRATADTSTDGGHTGTPLDGAGYERFDTGSRTNLTGLPDDGARPVWIIWPDTATGDYTVNPAVLYQIDYHDRQGEPSSVGWTAGEQFPPGYPAPDPRLVTIFTYNYPGAGLFTAFYPGLSVPFGSLVPAAPNPLGPSPELRYRLYLAVTTTGRIAYELPVQSLSWSSALNNIGTLSATVVVQQVYDALSDADERDPRNLFQGFLATGAYRYSLVLTYGNTVIWAGPYTPSTVPGDATITLGGSDFGALLQRRLLVGPNPPSADSDVTIGPCSKPELARRLVIEGASNGVRSLPWTMFDRPSDAGNETRTYFGYDLRTVWDALTTLSQEVDGPDFRFDPSLSQGSDGNYVSWNLVVGRPLLATPHEWGWDAPANATVSWQTNVSNFATDYYGSGSGQDRSKLIAVSSSSTLIDAGYPSLEITDSLHSQITDQDQLQSLTDADLAAYTNPVVRWQLSVQASKAPLLGSYRVGDTVQVRLQGHPVIPDGLYHRRITSMSGDASDQVQIVSSDDYTVIATTSTGVQIISSG